jgi:hypothetical protein
VKIRLAAPRFSTLVPAGVGTDVAETCTAIYCRFKDPTTYYGMVTYRSITNTKTSELRLV